MRFLDRSVFLGQPLLSIAYLQHRVMGSLTSDDVHWSQLISRFQATMNDSINLRLIVGCLLTYLQRYTLCQRFSIRFRSTLRQTRLCSVLNILVLFWPIGDQFGRGYVHCRPRNIADAGLYQLYNYIEGTMHFCNMPKYPCTWSH